MKKLIFIFLTLFWFVQPSYATVTQQHTGAHTKPVVHVKKHTKQTRLKKHRNTTPHKKVATKTAQRKKRVTVAAVTKPAAIPNDRKIVMEPKNSAEPKLTMNFITSIEQRLVDFVYKTVNTLRYSAYKLGGAKFDTTRGVYVLDCSDYVDHLLEEVYPSSYVSLLSSTGTDRPTTQHYYNFFSRLHRDPKEYWHKVEDVEELQAGDILVFRYKNTHGLESGGHVMVVMDKPIRDADSYLVRVADSARVGHSEDTRVHNVSGIGIGTMLLKVNPRTGEPSAYAWKVGSRWKSNVNIAMARPLPDGKA